MTMVINLAGLSWVKSSTGTDTSVALNGQLYLDQMPRKADAIGAELTACETPEQLTSFLRRLNGFYAWVEQSSGQVRAAVDHIRSRPLFYGLNQGQFYLSDDAEWIRQQVGDREMDPMARAEFQLAGYVTGPDTLFPSVKQLQAGECLIARDAGASPVAETHRYYRFLHQEPADSSEPRLRTQLDRVTLRVMQRLIDYANERQIVIPLSGGYDSRLIATMLKRLGYDNMLAFTYGLPGNKESECSKRVAEALGLRWHFVEYSEALWREAWRTADRWTHQQWASGWSSIPHMQDWLAVQKLNQGGVVEPDAIFVPGHTGDFISGGHIPSMTFERARFSPPDVGEAVQQKHYALAPPKLFSVSPIQWTARIQERAEVNQCGEPWEFASVCEKWEWQERQAKYICNSVRVYEHFGYDWWMPLWDLEFVRFWETVPLRMRKARQWYVRVVSDEFSVQGLTGTIQFCNARDPSVGLRLILALRRALPLPEKLAELVRKLVRNAMSSRSASPTFRGRYPEREYRDLLKMGFRTTGVSAYQVLQDLTAQLRRDS